MGQKIHRRKRNRFGTSRYCRRLARDNVRERSALRTFVHGRHKGLDQASHLLSGLKSRPNGKFIPFPAIQIPATGFWSQAAPLLEKEWYALGDALVADRACPS